MGIVIGILKLIFPMDLVVHYGYHTPLGEVVRIGYLVSSWDGLVDPFAVPIMVKVGDFSDVGLIGKDV